MPLSARPPARPAAHALAAYGLIAELAADGHDQVRVGQPQRERHRCPEQQRGHAPPKVEPCAARASATPVKHSTLHVQAVQRALPSASPCWPWPAGGPCPCCPSLRTLSLDTPRLMSGSTGEPAARTHKQRQSAPSAHADRRCGPELRDAPRGPALTLAASGADAPSAHLPSCRSSTTVSLERTIS